MKDAGQAHLQARIDGPAATGGGTSKNKSLTRAELPSEWWPAGWYEEERCTIPQFRRPVCRLERALYGHHEAGAVWQKRLNSELPSQDWELIEGAQALCATAAPVRCSWHTCFKHPAMPLQHWLGARHVFDGCRVDEPIAARSLTLSMVGYTRAAVHRADTDRLRSVSLLHVVCERQGVW